jgi:hypothetical protein
MVNNTVNNTVNKSVNKTINKSVNKTINDTLNDTNHFHMQICIILISSIQTDAIVIDTM